MSSNDVLEWVGEEVLKEYKNFSHNCGLQEGDCRVHHVGAGPDGEAAMELEGAEAVCAFRPTTCTREATGEAGSPLSRVGRRGRRRSPVELATRHCPLGSSFELILRAALSAMGGAPPCKTIKGRAQIDKADTEAYQKAHGSKK